MINRIKWIWIAGWSGVIMALAFFGMSIPGETYTVTTPVWSHTNVVEISRCSDLCMLIRYVEKGVTGEFHAFGVPIAIETNAVKIGQPVDTKWPKLTLEGSSTNDGSDFQPPPPPTTEWIGCPLTSNNDLDNPRLGCPPTVEIGLRSDGVVVWRTRK